MGPSETRRAIEAADARLPGLARAARRRSARAILRRLVRPDAGERQDDLARLLTTEQGKPLAEAKGEIAYAASSSSGSPRKASASTATRSRAHQADRRIVVLKRADRRVRAAITPWNFPAAMITRKAGPALAAGCTIVAQARRRRRRSRRWRCRAAPSAPACRRACFNVVTGTRARRIGAELTANPLVRKLSFTGSTEVGKLLMAQCARDDQEDLARTRRQRAVHRLRRRRPRRGGRGRDGLASTATPARPASAPTASSCRTASTTRSPPS